MEGKEVRFGIANSALWATATTAASNGSVNAMHDSFTPLGGLVPMWLMQLGEVVFGGVGSGLYGMLMFAIVAVFIAGLMVGRTPEYLGKKIEAYEMKMASLVLLIPCAVVLIGTAIASVVPVGTSSVANPGPHGFSEILYAFSSAGNNNGSAFGGLSANTPFYNTALGIAMWISRYWLIDPGPRRCRKPRAQAATLRSRSARYLRTHRSSFRCSCLRCCWSAHSPLFRRSPSGRSSNTCNSTAMNDTTRTASSIGASLPRRSTQLLTGPMFRTAVRDAFVKLDPRLQIRNPVMFVVFLGSILTTALAVAAFAGATSQVGEPWFVVAIAAWLWLTLLFANFAEAVAEGRGKAQADALRATRRDVQARRLIGRRREQGFDSGSRECTPARRRCLRRSQGDDTGRRRGHRRRRLGR